MDFHNLLPDDFSSGDLCCGVSSRNNDEGVAMKADWLKNQMIEGLVFRKGKGISKAAKVFIEYQPSETVWEPMVVSNCTHINCLWVSGRFAKSGNARSLMQACLDDAVAQQKDGVTALSSAKQKPYLLDYRFLKKFGFVPVDESSSVLLMYKALSGAAPPAFASCVRHFEVPSGLYISYTAQCPLNHFYVRQVLEAARQKGIPASANQILTLSQARTAPAPKTSYAAFFNGKYLGPSILTANNFEAVLQSSIK